MGRMWEKDRIGRDRTEREIKFQNEEGHRGEVKGAG